MENPAFELIHIAPGRVRLKGTPLLGNTELTQLLRDTLQSLAGVDTVATHAVTGTVTVDFDPAEEAVVVACLRGQLPEDADVHEWRHGDAPLALPGDVVAARRRRPTREEVRRRASVRRGVAAGMAAAVFAAGLVARRLLRR